MQQFRVSNRNMLGKQKLACWLRYKYVEQNMSSLFYRTI